MAYIEPGLGMGLDWPSAGDKKLAMMCGLPVTIGIQNLQLGLAETGLQYDEEFLQYDEELTRTVQLWPYHRC